MTEVPWGSWEEWRLARAQLYSPSLPERREGCRRVSAWTLRGNRIPLPVRSTWDLVEAQLLDSTGGPGVSSEQVRLAYSTAIVRMVNGAADDGQRGEFAQSIASLAQRIGLPKWLVDVRHESTHQVLPSVQVLRLACSQAMEWLNNNYWRSQEEELNNIQSNRLDLKIKEIAECLDRGAISRDVGPKPYVARKPMASTMTAVGSEEEMQLVKTAQDVVDTIRDYDAGRLAKALFRGIMADDDDWTKWERVLHWLDGEGSLRICRRLLLVCFTEALKDPSSTSNLKLFSLVRGLLSRRYHIETRPSLGKFGQKTLSIDTCEEWTNQEKSYMLGYAPDACRPQLIAGVRKCLANPTPQSRHLLLQHLLPALRPNKKKKDGTASEEVLSLLDEMFSLHEMINVTSTETDIERTVEEQIQSSEKLVDWKELEKFCEKTELNRKRIKVLSEEHLHTDEDVPVKNVNELQFDGSQPWTPVHWPGGPIGCVLRSPQSCPALAIVPPLLVDPAAVYHHTVPVDIEETVPTIEIGIDNSISPGLSDSDYANVILETSRKIRFMV